MKAIKETGEIHSTGRAPMLSPAEVADIRAMRAQGICYKLIQRKHPAHRVTLSRAANGWGAYA